ncbi:MAG: transposase [Bryobacterales bacterium]|nr:transposase [Bryobacterales bacterium]
MMARPGRFTPAGVPVHVTQRGNHRRETFESDGDYECFLRLLGKYTTMYQNRVVGYCLMPNHFHLVVVPEEERSVSSMIRALTSKYARIVNERSERKGHLWEDRFGSVSMSDRHYRTALAYVDLNPVRAGLVGSASDFTWSSAGAHMGLSTYPKWLDMREFRKLYTSEEWQETLRLKEDESAVSELRRATQLGRVLGDETFVRQLEQRYGKALEPRRPGRPRKVLAASV